MCIVVPVLNYRFPTVIDILPTEIYHFQSRIFGFTFSTGIPVSVPTKKYSNKNNYRIFPTISDRFHPQYYE